MAQHLQLFLLLFLFLASSCSARLCNNSSTLPAYTVTRHSRFQAFQTEIMIRIWKLFLVAVLNMASLPFTSTFYSSCSSRRLPAHLTYPPTLPAYIPTHRYVSRHSRQRNKQKGSFTYQLFLRCKATTQWETDLRIFTVIIASFIVMIDLNKYN